MVKRTSQPLELFILSYDHKELLGLSVMHIYFQVYWRASLICHFPGHRTVLISPYLVPGPGRNRVAVGISQLTV